MPVNEVMPVPNGGQLKIRVGEDAKNPGHRLLIVSDGTKQARVSVPMTATPYEKLEAVRKADDPVCRLSPTQALFFLSSSPQTSIGANVDQEDTDAESQAPDTAASGA